MTTNSDKCRDYAIVLAAGFSTRMGQCKATLPWHNGQTLLHYQLSQLLPTITPVVVLGQHNAQLQTTCPDSSRVVINPDASRGKTSSILAGLAALPDSAQTLIISAVDQPRSRAVYTRLLQAHRQSTAPITVPLYGDRQGHPLVLSAGLVPQLQTISEQTLGLRQIVQQYASRIQQVVFTTPEVLLDLNTPELYQSAVSRANTSATTWVPSTTRSGPGES
jgi:molybdenum cofactor cytidylyltransferase